MAIQRNRVTFRLKKVAVMARHTWQPKRMLHFFMIAVIVISIIPSFLIVSLLPQPSFAIDASEGPKTPVSSLSCTNATGVGTVAWTSPGNAYDFDDGSGTFASASVDGTTTNYLKCTNFGFAVPTGAVVTGISASIRRSASATNNGGVIDANVQLVKGSVIQTTNRATATMHGTSLTWDSYGSAADMWGTTWTATDINSSGFGIAIAAQKVSGGGAAITTRVENVTLTVSYSINPTFTQSAYRWFNNQDSGSPVNVGTPLGGVAQNTGAISPGELAIMRLRLLMHVGSSAAPAGVFNFKLQYAARGADNLCDTSFTNESYADVTTSTPISYANNPTATDGASLTANANDPTHSTDTVIRQQYEESNTISLASATQSGQDAMWDFALMDNSAPANTTYCLRLTDSSGGLLNSYSVIPQITSGSPGLSQENYRWFEGQSGASSNSFIQALGTESDEYGFHSAQTADNGRIVASIAEYSTLDVLLTKYDANGAVSWSKAWGEGGTYDEIVSDIIQTSDGGYAITGQLSNSSSTNVAFLSKLDSTGSVSWTKTLQGFGGSIAPGSIIQTSDGGYAMAGSVIGAVYGFDDMFIAKLDHTGIIEWTKIAGASAQDRASKIIQTLDGGYAVLGVTNSYGAGNYDILLSKYAVDGTLSWSKTWGGAAVEDASSFLQTLDGGYIVTGSTASYGSGLADLVVIKYSADGSVSWTRTWGSSTNYEVGASVIQTTDKGYAVAGHTSSFGAGVMDALFIKLSENGTISWKKTYGGTGNDSVSDLAQTASGGYTAVGTTYSYGAGAGELLFIKTDESGGIVGCNTPTCQSVAGTEATPSATTTGPVFSTSSVLASSISYTIPSTPLSPTITPVVGSLAFAKARGDANNNQGNALVHTSDGGYAVAGSHGSVAVLTKYASTGALEWSKTWDEVGSSAYSVIQTSDGGYAIAGTSGLKVFLAKYTSGGALSWSRTWQSTPGSQAASANSLIQTSDGGYAIVGTVSQNFYQDSLILKFTSAGILSWSSGHGDTSQDLDEQAYSVVQTADGGYLVVGSISGFASLAQYTSSGTLSWTRELSESALRTVISTNDGGYAAITASYGSPKLIKLDGTGTPVWSKVWSLSGSGLSAYSLIQTSDGGFAVTGSITTSSNTNSLFIKTDSLGTATSGSSFGGNGTEQGYQIVQAADGGYAVAGVTSGYGGGLNDTLILKYGDNGQLATCTSAPCQSLSLTTTSSTASVVDDSINSVVTPGTVDTTAKTSSVASATDTTIVAQSIWGSTNPTVNNPLGSQDAAGVSSRHDTPLRLRALLSSAGKPSEAYAITMKLQVAPMVGTCDPTFTGETYVDLGSSAPFAYYDTPNLTSGQFVSASVFDPAPTSGVRYYGGYQEATSFSNQQRLTGNQAELFDLSVTPTDSALYGSYCFRIVKSDNNLLSSYTRVFELSIPPATSQQLRHGKFFNEQGGTGLTPYYW